MRYLFLHPNFPAQFRTVAAALAASPGNEVVYITAAEAGELPGVHRITYKLAREPRKETHQYVRGLELGVLHGQAASRAALAIKAKGFVPDVIYGHSGWGSTLYMKDVFPNRPMLCSFEWFYHARGTDADFDPNEPLTLDDAARIRTKNAAILIDLYSCEAGSSATHWQKQQFPKEYHSKIHVCHEGIDTKYFVPKPGPLVLPRIGLDLSNVKELVTYVGRGMEPYRGFPQFIESVHHLLQKRPNCHVVIVGEDRVAYGRRLPRGQTYKKQMLEQFPLDSKRVHFTGPLPYAEYLQVLQASSAHVYLTRPFVLSWSMMEAMSAGCVVVGSDTAPVREVIENGVNGLLVDFFQPEKIADQVAEVLKRPRDFEGIRLKARQTISQRYDLAEILPRRVKWISSFV